MKKKVLITGISGFIGEAMARYLDSCRGFHVQGVDLAGRKRHFADFSYLDLLDEVATRIFLKEHRPDLIFHFAGGRLDDPQAMFAANVKTTQSLLGSVLSVAGYRPRVVVMGSAAEYGVCPGRKRIDEKMSGLLEGAYGRCKSLQTQTAFYFSALGADVIVARPFNVLGPGLPAATVGGAFARDIAAIEEDRTRRELQVGNLKAVRDFLDIRDVCAALLCLAHKGRSGEAYNVCSQQGISIRALLEQMLAGARCTDIIVHEDRRRSPGVLSAVGSCAKLMRETGWRPRYSLRESVADTLEHYRAAVQVRA